MFCVINFVTFLCIFTIPSNILAYFQEDYYWRDFDGVVPIDALLAGKSRFGIPIYIGQTLYENKLIPGKIYHNSKFIHIEYGASVFQISKNIKILCTQYSEKFVWISTTADTVFKMQDRHIFEGGYEEGVLTYIGRVLHNGELTIGKLICFAHTRCLQLIIVYGENRSHQYKFEILTFDDSIRRSTTQSSTISTTTSTPTRTTSSPSTTCTIIPTTPPITTPSISTPLNTTSSYTTPNTTPTLFILNTSPNTLNNLNDTFNTVSISKSVSPKFFKSDMDNSAFHNSMTVTNDNTTKSSGQIYTLSICLFAATVTLLACTGVYLIKHYKRNDTPAVVYY